MKNALWFATSLCLLAGPVLADDTDKTAIAAARDFVLSALPGQCDDDVSMYGDDAGFTGTAYPLSWKPDWGGENDPDQHATLYQVFCMAGAYNLVHAYVFKPQDDAFSLISFAEPVYTYDYANDEQTELKAAPKLTGFSTTATLVNSEFDAEAGTLTSFSKWRGLGDAWSSGTWAFTAGVVVLSAYEIDPTYDSETASDEQRQKSYKIYP